jgi:Xaa-Pro aminopeptidase
MSDQIFKDRQARLKSVLAENSFDGMLISNLTNVRYLSGFTGSAGTCIITPDNNYFITDGRYMEQSKHEVNGFERYVDYGTHIEIAQKNNLINDGLKLAFESDNITISVFQQMKKLFPKVQWEGTKMILEMLSAVKDQTEIDALKTAIEITDTVFSEIVELIKVGTTEKEIALEIAMRYWRYAEGEAFPTIVATGKNSALPHYQPADCKFQKGDFVVIDTGAKYAGYHADMTRTVVVGEASEKQNEIYNIVKRSQQAGIDTAKAGVSCKAVDDATRKVITEAGYGDNYIHSAGHGIGLEIHAYPRFSQQSEDILEENNVMTIEPGIYLTDLGGVRIEDDILVKQSGSEVLNTTTKDLLIV